MAKYKFVIKEEKDKGYLFILYPNNNNNQEVGRSIYYLDRDKCSKALIDFKTFVNINKIDNDQSKFVNIKEKNERWFFEYIKDGKVVFFRYYGYEDEDNARKIISSIYKNIDVD